MSSITTKTVLGDDKISGIQFFIKDYQRGYRWEKKQIEDLLNDVFLFDSENEKYKYCLQPLIVKPIEKPQNFFDLKEILEISDLPDEEIQQYYELIDGQQRLTTLWLILEYCNSTRKPLPYAISYEYNRPIDREYLKDARKTIENWFSQCGEDDEDTKYEIRKRIHRSVQFIWYEVDKERNSNQIFDKINRGKIPLTNAELFKAKLLNEDDIVHDENFELNKYNLNKIALEWDRIEQSLHEDEFWKFLSNDNMEPRMEFLLELKAELLNTDKKGEGPISKEDHYYSFLFINDYIMKGEDKKIQYQIKMKIWEEIVEIHDLLKSYWNDNEFYHKIGFLVATRGEKRKESYIKTFLERIKREKLDQDKVKALIQADIKEVFKNVNLDDLEYDQTGDKEKIRNVLLYFNIYTMIKSGTKTRFSFSQYKDKDMSWDLEHIHARKTEAELKEIENPDTMKELLINLKAQFESLSFFPKKDEVIDKIDCFINDIDTKKNSEFVEFYNEMTRECGEFDENSIKNLTLLDSKTNRSYQNALYPVKREIIINKDKGEVFIPVCTKNVFLKMYSKKLTDMARWTNEDADDYYTVILDCFKEAKIWQ